MRKRIDEYFEIVLRSVKDSVPKTCGFFLVRKSETVLQMDLYNAVNNNPNMADFLGEPKQITERRKHLNDILKSLREAVKALQRDPEICANTVGDSELEADIRRQQMEMQMPKNQRKPGGPPPMKPRDGPNQSMNMSRDDFMRMQAQA